MFIGIDASAQQDGSIDASERDDKPYARNLLSLGVVPLYLTWYFRQDPPVDMGSDNKIDQGAFLATGLSASYTRRLSHPR